MTHRLLHQWTSPWSFTRPERSGFRSTQTGYRSTTADLAFR
jgi:hypothetical protein